jgi:replicative DNA helicase
LKTSITENMTTDNTLIDYEQDLIGAILADNECFDLVDIKPHNFLINANKLIFEAIAGLLNEGKAADIITVAELLDKQGKLDGVGGLQYIGSIVQNSIASKKTIKNREAAIVGKFKRRKIGALVNTLHDMVESHEDVEVIAELCQNGIDEIIDNSYDEGFAHIGQAVAEAVDWEDHETKGLKTGIRDLDRLTDGFKNSDLIIIAARPSMGKSSLACQIGEHVAHGQNVIIFSLEMAKRQVASRMLKFHEARVGKSQAIAHLYDLKMHVDDSSAVTLGHIRSKCRQIKRKFGLGMIVVDYIQLMRGEGDNRNQEIGSISRGLKGIAKEFDIPVIALSQLNRKVDDRGDKRPVMSDLRESGEIEQDADVILFIYRDEMYNPDTEHKGLAEIICRKNRNGSIGEITTEFHGETTRFGDYNGERILRVVKNHKRGFE